MRVLRRIAKAIGVALLAVAFLALVYRGLTFSLRAGQDDLEAAYTEAAVTRGDLRETVVATGRTQPLARVVLQSEIAGVVAAVHVDDGDRVAAGDALVELDRDRLDYLAAELRAALRMAQADARADLVGRARAELSQARREHARIADLHAGGVASREQRDDAAHALALAEIALRDAEAEAARRDAAVSRARAALRRAEEDLEKSVIRAPHDGVVVRRRVEVGSAVTDLEHGGTVVAELADDRRIHVLAEVDENDIARVREGAEAEVRIDAFPGEVFEGRVRKVSWSGNAEGHLASFEVEIELQPDPRFRVGMSADARIVVGVLRDVLLVPTAAIVRGDGGPFLRTAPAEDAPLAAVREGASDGFQTVILDGVGERDRVFIETNGALP